MNIKTRKILGYLGLIPFFSFSFLPLAIPFPEGYIFNLLLSFYGGIILSLLREQAKTIKSEVEQRSSKLIFE